ncbi:hypothetical protein [Streptomyces sp. NPDC050145]|uniref:hypothetical protein n=1 Tax=Streptomyces sp. NPDC050145 TaxID=3365602 RepID=UPI003797193B
MTEAPELEVGQDVLAQVASVRGSRVVELDGGIRKSRKRPLSIMVNCQGRGALKVTVRPIGMKFPLACTEGRVQSAYNQIEVAETHDEASVKVVGASGVRWSMAVGW